LQAADHVSVAAQEDREPARASAYGGHNASAMRQFDPSRVTL
jgi:hypothetical protein